MHDIVVGKAADDVRNRIGLADIRQELIAEPLAFRCAGDKPRDIDELDRCRNRALRPRDRGERRESRIGNLDDAHVGLDGAKRIVFRRGSGPGKRIEQRRLADVRQADDAASEAHGLGFPSSPAVPPVAGGCALAGRVCSSCIALSISPEASRGQIASARATASSISTRSSARGGCST